MAVERPDVRLVRLANLEVEFAGGVGLLVAPARADLVVVIDFLAVIPFNLGAGVTARRWL
jgi:hypothetical protein